MLKTKNCIVLQKKPQKLTHLKPHDILSCGLVDLASKSNQTAP